MDHQHGLDYVRSVFVRVGANLVRPVTVYHIGGNAMCWHGLKNTTKDVDIVFLANEGAEAFRRALLVSGFIENEVVCLDGGYANLNTFGIFDEVKQTPLGQAFTPGLRVDVFLTKVCGIFDFSKDMKKRCVRGFDSGKIVNMVCAPEDIFLFKSVTSRERDLDDMDHLFKKGLDWNAVEDELRGQLRFMGAGKAKEHLKTVSGCWRLFSRRFGVKIPINLNTIKK